MHAGFLREIYSRLNASVILKRNEMPLEKNKAHVKKRDAGAQDKRDASREKQDEKW